MIREHGYDSAYAFLACAEEPLDHEENVGLEVL